MNIPAKKKQEELGKGFTKIPPVPPCLPPCFPEPPGSYELPPGMVETGPRSEVRVRQMPRHLWPWIAMHAELKQGQRTEDLVAGGEIRNHPWSIEYLPRDVFFGFCCSPWSIMSILVYFIVFFCNKLVICDFLRKQRSMLCAAMSARFR